MVTVMAGNFTAGGVRGGVGAASSLKVEDLDAIRKEVPNVQYIAPGVNTARAGDCRQSELVDPARGHRRRFPADSCVAGQVRRVLQPSGCQQRPKVAVLGKTVSEQLFGPDVDPTGQMIRVRNQPFKVIGVMDTKGQAAMGNDQDDTIFAPYTTVQKRLQGQQNIQNITISAASADAVSDVADAIAVVMRNQHKLIPGEPDDFTIRTQEEIADIRTATVDTMTNLLAGIAGVSLIVGGIGIMNIMLVSVTERTREIGIRMAIGAKGRDVLLQFLVEAVVISLLGGGIGIALGLRHGRPGDAHLAISHGGARSEPSRWRSGSRPLQGSSSGSTRRRRPRRSIRSSRCATSSTKITKNTKIHVLSPFVDLRLPSWNFV